MRQERSKRRFGFALMMSILVIGAGMSVLAWKEHQHKSQLTPMALDLVKLSDSKTYPREIWDTYRSFIEQGAWDEDFPCGLSGVRANNHYYHSLSGRGLSDAPWVGLGDPDVGTPAWAVDNRSLARAEEFGGGDNWAFKRWGWTPIDVDLGDMSWKRAIQRYGYTENSKRLAYYTLGFICHLLQDMGAPEHVHDDPHGASGYTGFELWVWRNWDSLKPSIGSLRPRTFGTVEDFFRNLSLLGYSIDRFQGGELTRGSGAINPSSDLGKMFKVRYNGPGVEWVLENHGGSPILAWSSPGGGSNLMNSDFEWNWGDYRRDPLGTKGHDQGEWWPTSLEIPGSELNDEEGYYYIELSGDLPGEPFNITTVADPGRNLFPAAFLPSPLPEVADQCATWRVESTGGLHLYSLIGQKIFPAIVEHTAGLVEHFFDIVNHPPFVSRVQVSQAGGGRYSVYWEDVMEAPSASITVTDVRERLLTEEAANPARTPEISYFAPGQASIRVVFSEPVHSPVVKVGGRMIRGSLDEGGSIWTGDFMIEENGPSEEMRTLAIYAEDQNAHYGNEGGRLDRDPATPAKRTENYPEYSWLDYESGEDTHYRIQIKRTTKTPPAAVTERQDIPSLVWQESESYTNTIGGTWTLNPETRLFHARWHNGAQATLQLEKYSENEVIVTRHDASGTSAGLSARYVGKRDGRRVSGTVTWQWQGRTWSGTWEASW